MILYYLGVPVRPLHRSDGWLICEWRDGKRWKHWPPQLKTTAWGRDA